MKKKILYALTPVFFISAIYLGYKLFCLYYYNIDTLTTVSYHEIIKNLSNESKIILHTDTYNEEEYYTYKNIKIKNDFHSFAPLEQRFSEESSEKLVLKDNEETIAAFWMSKTKTFTYYLKMDTTIFGTEDSRVTSKDISKYLEKNKITNDLELYQHLKNKKNLKNHIFTPVQKMKERFTLKFLIATVVPTMESITLINGDYEGYIFNLNNMKEVSIIKGDNRYVFEFVGLNYFTDEKIYELLNSIVIDEK